MIINFNEYLKKFDMSITDDEMLTELEFLASYDDCNTAEDEIYYKEDNAEDTKRLILKNIYAHLKYVKDNAVISYEIWNMLRILVLKGMELNIIKNNKVKAYLNILINAQVNCLNKYEINFCLKEMASLKLRLIELEKAYAKVKVL